ncbi:uncharacterized protein KQ657_000459 [Scheffersomyces spartinae]|uniref:Cyclin-D1-binding protein 1-like N-terminal domain-containing protein n=1 Tax=Scheffersomyces spartinae TaxID=45513 RepID=A0A9P8AHV5_9ASCO|nr:uncharacterized protein KQ657_000459 [Scheffersomyces spartinae]KAG7193767.1 hypothetical protein KQ657_000459 [Scheffersomyces spartinae]
MAKTIEDVKERLEAFQGILSFWNKSLRESTPNEQVGKAKVVNPLEEVNKLAKLIKAHSTKTGIAFSSATIGKHCDAGYDCIQKLSESMMFMLQIRFELNPTEMSQLHYDEVFQLIISLFEASTSFSTELIKLVDEVEAAKDGGNDNEAAAGSDKLDNTTEGTIDSGRLVSVGRMWSICDELVLVVQGGKVAVLSKKLKQSIALIDDGLEEFAEWTENPDSFDIEDPFGFSDEFDSDEEDDTRVPTHEVNESDDEDDKTELLAFAKVWLQNIKLIKLLLNSLAKSLSSATKGQVIDTIYKTQLNVVGLIDKLIVDLMMDQVIDDEIEGYGKEIGSNCFKIVKITKDVNKQNESKVKWCTAWEAKFTDNNNKNNKNNNNNNNN